MLSCSTSSDSCQTPFLKLAGCLEIVVRQPLEAIGAANVDDCGLVPEQVTARAHERRAVGGDSADRTDQIVIEKYVLLINEISVVDASTNNNEIEMVAESVNDMLFNSVFSPVVTIVLTPVEDRM